MTAVRQLPSFWLTLLIGWVPIVLGTVVAAATVAGEPNKLAQHAMLLVTCLLPSIPLCLIQRSLWRHRASWRRYVAVLLSLSFLLAFAGTAVIIGLATRLGGHVGALRGGFRWSFVFGSMDIVWFVLLATLAVVVTVRATRERDGARHAQLRA